MELPTFSHTEEVLFNMAGELFPVLAAAAMDLSQVFKDVLVSVTSLIPDVIDVFTIMDKVR